jgi:hypothetical protein
MDKDKEIELLELKLKKVKLEKEILELERVKDSLKQSKPLKDTIIIPFPCPKKKEEKPITINPLDYRITGPIGPIWKYDPPKDPSHLYRPIVTCETQTNYM